MDTVPNKVEQLSKALRFHERKAWQARDASAHLPAPITIGTHAHSRRWLRLVARCACALAVVSVALPLPGGVRGGLHR
jgi:hypothetical protein